MILALIMWILAIILGIADYKTESTRWAMALIFFAGLAGFGVFWGDNASIGYFGLTARTNRIIETLISAMSHYFIPYCALMFGLNYAEFLRVKYKKLIPMLLLIPLMITFLFYPTHDYGFETSFQTTSYYRVFSIWAVPYLLFSCTLLIYACVNEEIPSIKRQRIICCLIAIPGMVFSAITTYLLGGLPVDGAWKYWRFNIIITPYVFIIFSYNLFKYGVLGIKLQIKKQNLGNMMDVLNSGMKILSHSLKNEITKISICMTNIQLSLNHPVQDDNDINENIKMVATSLEYLSNMMAKLQKNSINPGKFELANNNLTNIIETALQRVAVFLKTKNIHIYKNLNGGLSIKCDKIYLEEVFVSLYQNAIEAMTFEGELTIETRLTSKGLIITIKDNGAGICEKDLPHVIEPFFTTKDRKGNFGLGLSYCYNVLTKHGALIDVQSERNIGTTVSLFFPKNKILFS